MKCTYRKLTQTGCSTRMCVCVFGFGFAVLRTFLQHNIFSLLLSFAQLAILIKCEWFNDKSQKRVISCFLYSRTSFKLTDKNLVPPFPSHPMLEHYAQYSPFSFFQTFFVGIRSLVDCFHFIVFSVWFFCCSLSVRTNFHCKYGFCSSPNVQVNLINWRVFFSSLFLVFSNWLASLHKSWSIKHFINLFMQPMHRMCGIHIWFVSETIKILELGNFIENRTFQLQYGTRVRWQRNTIALWRSPADGYGCNRMQQLCRIHVHRDQSV